MHRLLAENSLGRSTKLFSLCCLGFSCPLPPTSEKEQLRTGMDPRLRTLKFFKKLYIKGWIHHSRHSKYSKNCMKGIDSRLGTLKFFRSTASSTAPTCAWLQLFRLGCRSVELMVAQICSATPLPLPGPTALQNNTSIVR
jgi:hypothetical protein